MRVDSAGGDLHSGKEKGGDQKVGIFPKVEREAFRRWRSQGVPSIKGFFKHKEGRGGQR